MRVCVCLSVWVCGCLSVSPSFSLSVSLSLCLFQPLSLTQPLCNLALGALQLLVSKALTVDHNKQAVVVIVVGLKEPAPNRAARPCKREAGLLYFAGQRKHGVLLSGVHTHTRTHTHTHTHTHSLTTHSLTHTHAHTHSLTHTHTHMCTHSHTYMH